MIFPKVKETEFLRYKEIPNPGKKTKIFHILTKVHEGNLLGKIKWHGAWRQYVFFPEGDTLFDRKCLKDIISFIDELMVDRKTKQEENA